MFYIHFWLSASLAQTVKNLPLLAMKETQVWSLCQEDPLEKQMSIHSSTLSWRMSWTEKPGGLQSMWSQRVGHDWATNTLTFTFTWGSSPDRFVRLTYTVSSLPSVNPWAFPGHRDQDEEQRTLGWETEWCLRPASATVREAFCDPLKCLSLSFLTF